MADITGVGGLKGIPTVANVAQRKAVSPPSQEVLGDRLDASSFPPEQHAPVRGARIQFAPEAKTEAPNSNRPEPVGDLNTDTAKDPASLQEFLKAQSDKFASNPTVYQPQGGKSSLVPSSLMMEEVSLRGTDEGNLERAFTVFLQADGSSSAAKLSVEACPMSPEMSWQVASGPSSYQVSSEESLDGKSWDYSFPKLTDKSSS